MPAACDIKNMEHTCTHPEVTRADLLQHQLQKLLRTLGRFGRLRAAGRAGFAKAIAEIK